MRSQSIRGAHRDENDENTGKGATDGMKPQRRQERPEIKRTGGRISEELEDRTLPWSCKEGGWDTSRYQPRDIYICQGEKSDRGLAHLPYSSMWRRKDNRAGGGNYKEDQRRAG